jgi:hypothetical protein
MLQPEIEPGSAGLLHLQEITSKISRHGCSAIRQSEAFRGEADQPPLHPACVCSKTAALPLHIHPDEPCNMYLALRSVYS